jgi:hypothetical protein
MTLGVDRRAPVMASQLCLPANRHWTHRQGNHPRRFGIKVWGNAYFSHSLSHKFRPLIKTMYNVVTKHRIITRGNSPQNIHGLPHPGPHSSPPPGPREAPAPCLRASSPPRSTSSGFLKFMDPVHAFQRPVMGSRSQDLEPWGERIKVLSHH